MSTTTFVPKFELQYRANPQDPSEKKWYAKAISNGTVDTESLTRQISTRCTVTRHDVKAVLSALQELIGEYISMGCAVRLDDIGIFRLELQGRGCPKAEDYTSSLIENTMLRFLPSDGMKTIVKNITPEWVSNGVSDTPRSQSQLAAERG